MIRAETLIDLGEPARDMSCLRECSMRDLENLGFCFVGF